MYVGCSHMHHYEHYLHALLLRLCACAVCCSATIINTTYNNSYALINLV